MSDYETFINNVVSGLGQGKAVVVVEPDALSDISCQTGSMQSEDYQLINYAVQHLDGDSNAQVYVDAGNPGWVSAGTEASELQAAVGSLRAGFAVNTSNFYSVAQDVTYGDAISAAAGGRHFVIDTSRDGGTVVAGAWCNPAGAQLGVAPTTSTGSSLVDAFLWIKDPGESDGTCSGTSDPSAGTFWMSYALQLTAGTSTTTTTTPTTPTTTTTTTTTTPTTATTGTPVALSGVYVAAADPGATAAFAAWRGSAVTLVSDYLGHDGDWSGLTSPDYWLDSWQSYTNAGIPLVLGVPMIAASGDTFQAGAAGAYDSYYQTLASQLVAAGDGSAILRLGWEFNGDWYPWSVTATGADSPANFIADWQHTVIVMRAIAPNLRFVWNVNNGANPTYSVASTYPGNAYVDYVGVDAYDSGGWNTVLNQTDGLAYWLSFAKQQGKSLAIPEWGIGTSGDDPAYIQDMYQWMKTNQASIALESFYDYQDGATNGSFPNSAAEYQSLYK